MQQKIALSKQNSMRTAFGYYYGVGVISITIGIIVVASLNLFTPLQIVQNSILGREQAPQENIFLFLSRSDFLPIVFLTLCLAYGIVIVGLRHLLKPIANCISIDKKGGTPDDNQIHLARKRLLNLHYLFARMNILLWISFSILAGAGSVATGAFSMETAIIFAARASMVGLIASSIATLRIEIVSRKVLIPQFFPEGVPSQMEGVIQRSIGQQLVTVNRLGALVPIVILLITLLTLQLELVDSSVTAKQYGRELIVFVIVLALWVLLFSKQLSMLQSRNIVEPINELVAKLRKVDEGKYDERIQVTSNDEIGYAGEVVNFMTEGLKEKLSMQYSLDLARQVQQNLLPDGNPDFAGLDIAGQSIYCDETGGDFYDFIELNNREDKLSIVVGDVSGHGISSALLMATVRGCLRQRLALPGSISEIITDVNRQLAQDVGDSGNFMTMFVLIVDKHNRSIEWIRAGHDPAIVYDDVNNTISELKGVGLALGVDRDYQFEANDALDLCSGQIILLGTDGIWETQNSTGAMFGKKAVEKLLREYAHYSASEILAEIIQSLQSFRGNVPAEDDITCIIIKVS